MLHPRATERLYFREWRTHDAPLAIALWTDPRVTALIGGQLDEGGALRRLQAEIDLLREHGIQYWPIFLHDGTHLGCCGLRPRSKSVLEIGFHLRPEAWGRGYATEAARSAIDFAFAERGASALFAGHNPRNASSRRTLEKLGFTWTHDELYPPTGMMHPSYLLSR